MHEPLDAQRLGEVGLAWAVDGAVATLTLNRPEVRNAQTPAMWRAMARLGTQVPPDVRVVLVRGAGQSFSAGLDRRMLDPTNDAGEETIVGLLAKPDDQLAATIEEYQQGFNWLRNPAFISVALVQGHAIGAGFQLALACDLRVISPDAEFCMKETALGLVPDLTGTKPLVELVGYSRALDLCASARKVDATEAMNIGLANRLAADGDLDGAAESLVASLTAALPGAIRETKALLAGAQGRGEAEQQRLEREAQCRRMRELADLFGS